MTTATTSPARTALLDAGLRLADRVAYASLDADAIVAEAKLPPAQFAAEFPGGITDFVAALQQRFLSTLRDQIVAATSGLASGPQRLRAGTVTFFDRCLEARALRRWLVEARDHANVAEGLKRQNQAFMLILGAEFAALGFPHPQAAGRLFLAMLYEVSLAELAADKPLPELRDALWRLIPKP